MIPCTDFIPCYSEFFKFLERKHGKDEVDKYWEYTFRPAKDGIPLVECVNKEGLHGCWTYWEKSLNEEAAGFTMYLNEHAGWFLLEMHQCPSKGKLLKLEKRYQLEPYNRYCMHCDGYRAAVAQVGLEYIYNFRGIDKAACSILIFDPKIFNGKVIIDENTIFMDRKASDNEYFHRDFHSGINSMAEYLGKNYGAEEIQEFFEHYMQVMKNNNVNKMETTGLQAIEEAICEMYRKEKAESVLKIVQNQNGFEVTIDVCPVISHIKVMGLTISEWYSYIPETIMKTLAKNNGCRFVKEYYDVNSGAAKYHFEKRE